MQRSKLTTFFELKKRKYDDTGMPTSYQIKDLDGFLTLADVVEKIKRSANIIVIAGAGISVSSGIPDFRSKNGIYEMSKSLNLDLVHPEDLFDLEVFKKNPAPFYKFAKFFFTNVSAPSATHWFLKALEKKGKLRRLYTQNIDGLEHDVGIVRMVTCHGSLVDSNCQKCRQKFRTCLFKEEIMAGGIPHCTSCGGVVKPNVTFFGEKLPISIDRLLSNDSAGVDLVIVIGTSLKVAPVSNIIKSMPKEATKVLINRENLQSMNSSKKRFDVNLLGDCDLVVSHLNKMLRWSKLPNERDISITRPPVRVPPNSYLFGGMPLSIAMKISSGYESEEVVTCDECEKRLTNRCIVFNCNTCQDFDLCAKCYAKGSNMHFKKKSHVFTRIKISSMSQH